ncbi:hypothetical protein QCA50_011725 [Cerrena zonata]|uniref:C2H2-type domain-containing protein n=1 Tax=Cerrena zonata TaxID=2478898 RepID=A0AAW0G8K0_9APHY
MPARRSTKDHMAHGCTPAGLGNDPALEPTKCKICSKKYAIGVMVKHVRDRHSVRKTRPDGNLRYKCPCPSCKARDDGGEWFSTPRFNTHYKNYAGIKDCFCSLCPWKSAHSSALTRHKTKEHEGQYTPKNVGCRVKMLREAKEEQEDIIPPAVAATEACNGLVNDALNFAFSLPAHDSCPMASGSNVTLDYTHLIPDYISVPAAPFTTPASSLPQYENTDGMSYNGYGYPNSYDHSVTDFGYQADEQSWSGETSSLFEGHSSDSGESSQFSQSSANDYAQWSLSDFAWSLYPGSTSSPESSEW